MTTYYKATRPDGTSFYDGCELNPEYAEMSRQRIIGDAPLLNQVAEVVA